MLAVAACNAAQCRNDAIKHLIVSKVLCSAKGAVINVCWDGGSSSCCCVVVMVVMVVLRLLVLVCAAEAAGALSSFGVLRAGAPSSLQPTSQGAALCVRAAAVGAAVVLLCTALGTEGGGRNTVCALLHVTVCRSMLLLLCEAAAATATATAAAAPAAVGLDLVVVGCKPRSCAAAAVCVLLFTPTVWCCVAAVEGPAVWVLMSRSPPAAPTADVTWPVCLGQRLLHLCG